MNSESVVHGQGGAAQGMRYRARVGGLQVPPSTRAKTQRLRSLRGFVHERLPRVEAQLRDGWRLEKILQDLAAEGIFTTRGGLKNALHHARRRAKVEPPPQPPKLAPTQPAPVEPLQPAGPALPSPEQLRKTSGFRYDGTANLDPDDLI